MKKLTILAVLVLAMVAVPVWAGEKELQQQLGANVAAAQKLAARQQAIQVELSKIPKVMELSKESQEIQAKLEKLGQENQGILKQLEDVGKK